MHNAQRAFGVDDRMPCPECDGRLSLIRRGPHPEGKNYEAQIFGCSKCDFTEHRAVDIDGHIKS